MKRYFLRFRALLVLAFGALVLTAGDTDTNEVGPPHMAVVSGTGVTWITTSTLDITGKPLSTWRKVTKFRYLSGGTGVSTVELGFHLVSGWGTTGSALSDDIEWNDEWKFKEMDLIAKAATTAKRDTVAMMDNGVTSGVLVLGGE